MVTSPPPTAGGTRPDTKGAPPALFDAEELLATIEDRLGRWAGRFSVAYTLTLDAALNRLLPTAPARLRVAKATLIAMGRNGWTDIPSALVAYVAATSAGRARNHQRRLVEAGILERDPARPRTWRPGPVARLAMPELAGDVSRAPKAREVPDVPRAPKARGTKRDQIDNHHHAGAHAREGAGGPPRLPWLTDEPCPTAGCEGRLATRPDGKLDAVCKACRLDGIRRAESPPPAKPRRYRCNCGAPLPTTMAGDEFDECAECFQAKR